MFSCDIKPDAIKTYNVNFDEQNVKSNIFNVDDLPSFDLLCAGFPCQPFSSAGNKQGFDDDRGGIIFKIIELCGKYSPKYVILENVANLAVLNDGKTILKICDEFRKIGYTTHYKKLNAQNFGVPQNRERIFIVCSKQGLHLDLDIITARKPLLLTDIIDYDAKYTDIDRDFADSIVHLHSKQRLYGFKIQDKRGGGNNIHSWDFGNNITEDQKKLMSSIMTERRKKHWAEHKKIDWMDGMPLTTQEITTFCDHENLQHLLDDLVVKKYLRLEKPKKILNNKRIYDTDGENGYNICKGKLSFPVSHILDPHSVSPTLTATDCSKLAVIIDDTYVRKLTNNELKKINGFPISYIIPEGVNKYDLFGNMVCPPVVESILECIF